MKIEHLRLLVLISLAAIVLAAPAAAQAELTWSNSGTIEVTGGITSSASGLVTGPASVHLEGAFSNEGGMGEGFIDGMVATESVPTNLPGCHASITSTAAENAWPITLTTEDTIDIGSEEEPLTYTYHYTTGVGTGCPAFGVPATIPVKGMITGTVENDGEGNACIDLNNDVDDTVVELSGASVNLSSPSGPFCIEGVEVE